MQKADPDAAGAVAMNGSQLDGRQVLRQLLAVMATCANPTLVVEDGVGGFRGVLLTRAEMAAVTPVLQAAAEAAQGHVSPSERQKIREEALEAAAKIADELGRAARDTQRSTQAQSGPGQCYDYETLAGRFYAGNARGAAEKANDIAQAIRAWKGQRPQEIKP